METSVEVSMDVMKGATEEVDGMFHESIFHGDGGSFDGSTQEFPWTISVLPWKLPCKPLARKNTTASTDVVEASIRFHGSAEIFRGNDGSFRGSNEGFHGSFHELLF